MYVRRAIILALMNSSAVPMASAERTDRSTNVCASPVGAEGSATERLRRANAQPRSWVSPLSALTVAAAGTTVTMGTIASVLSPEQDPGARSRT